ncbi:hypothetical protein OG339_48555 (plasmid) [Streptosporangium sp. NBC_01495]|uniref:hypothetical protein n=1 Tax=Streptosporangium sp. NBC_01495 TaxID=2903899 RepID=UPI002E339F42|nr:hypothetical protein [Streptosporangium sp. NBC_01495]
MTVSEILIAAADRIAREGWASHYQQPGLGGGDAIALAVRDALETDTSCVEVQAAAFGALRPTSYQWG